jgi:hypothetical protein
MILVLVLIGGIWLFGEPAVYAFKRYWAKRQAAKLPPIENDFEQAEQIWRAS